MSASLSCSSSCWRWPALVATLVRQFPVTAADDPTGYAAELAAVHEAWNTIAPLGLPVGSVLVGAFDLLGLFNVFATPWFLLLMAVLTISIVCCTLDRTTPFWRGAREVRVRAGRGVLRSDSRSAGGHQAG